MKKLYKLAALALLSVPTFAQTAFWTHTTYRGAFAPSPTPMWTDNWTEWNPQNKVYANTNVTISANITTNTTWTSNNTYLIQGQIYVKNGAVLTIEPGTVIMGDKSSTGAGLFITQGAKIMAEGTVTSPIVFTSNQPAGQRGLGDWGGIILMGNATMNTPGDTAHVEGIAPINETRFGGGATPNDNDNSGILKYVRIEFGGYIYQPNKEINGLTLGAVGRGTTIDYVQVSFANDDAFEWFGGTVDCKHLVSYRNLDDDFDTDNGFSGRVQFGLIVRDPSLADNPTVSTSEGFESDNDASGSTSAPLTSAAFSNVTLIGPYRGNTSATIASGYRRSLRLRRNTTLKVLNSIFMDTPRGVHIDGTLCENNASSGTLKVQHNLFSGHATGKATETNTTVTAFTQSVTTWFAQSMNDSLVSSTGILTTPYNYFTPDYRPATSSPALATASFTNTSIFNSGFVGVNELANNTVVVELYPNPANDILNVNIGLENSNEAITINIINILGEIILTKKQIIQNSVFNIQHLTSGVYYVQINVGNNTFSKKLIITH